MHAGPEDFLPESPSKRHRAEAGRSGAEEGNTKEFPDSNRGGGQDLSPSCQVAVDLSHQTASLVSSLQTDGVNVEEQKTNAGKAQKNKSRAAGLHERVMRLARECDFDVSAVERISAENALQEKKQAKKSSMKTQTRSEWPADLAHPSRAAPLPCGRRSARSMTQRREEEARTPNAAAACAFRSLPRRTASLRTRSPAPPSSAPLPPLPSSSALLSPILTLRPCPNSTSPLYPPPPQPLAPLRCLLLLESSTLLLPLGPPPTSAWTLDASSA
eukprot:206093-Rhodomonas_salina.2